MGYFNFFSAATTVAAPFFNLIACGAEHGDREVVRSVLPSADMALLGELRGDSPCFGEYAILLP